MNLIVIHQAHVGSIFANESDLNGFDIKAFMEKYGHLYRTFKHGALHGTIAALFFVLPTLGINALFERRGFKYFLINIGYWIVCLAIVGGLICGFPK
jgi:hypothetical protein